MKWLVSRLTMICDESISGFVDVVSGGFVKYWVDCNGHYWLAESRWSFRIPVRKPNRYIPTNESISRESHLINTFPLSDGTTYIQSLDKFNKLNAENSNKKK